VKITVGHLQGQSNGKTESAFLDFQAGQPDANGFTKVDIIGASDFIFADATRLAGFVICIKPLVPVTAAGLLACNGGLNSTISLTQDHHIGQVGINGFTAAQCTAQQGHVEVPYAACSAGTVNAMCDVDADCDTTTGAGDAVCTQFPAHCTSGNVGAACQTAADCATKTNSGQCGMPHPGVCNGPLVPGMGPGDSGPGSLLIVPDPDPMVQLNGLPVELGFEAALPCGDEGPGMPSPFALTSGFSQSVILDADNMLGQTLSFQVQGENFSCQQWQDNSVGRLVLSAPAIDQMVVGDVATLFNFASH